MDDAKRAIIEDELDTMAGRIGDVEERLGMIVKLLSTPPALEKLGLDEKEVVGRCRVYLPGGDRLRQSQSRRDRYATAELDTFRRRVACAESVMKLTGGSFPEAWADTAKHYGDIAAPTPSDSSNIWGKALAHVAKVVNRYSFATWFQQTSLVRDDGEMLIVRASDPLTAAWLQTHHAKTIADAVAAAGRPTTRVQFVVAEIASRPAADTPSMTRQRRRDSKRQPANPGTARSSRSRKTDRRK